MRSTKSEKEKEEIFREYFSIYYEIKALKYMG